MKNKFTRNELFKIFKETKLSDSVDKKIKTRNLNSASMNIKDIKRKILSKLANKGKYDRDKVYKKLNFRSSDVKELERLIRRSAIKQGLGLSLSDKRRNIKESRKSAVAGVGGIAGGTLASSSQGTNKHTTSSMLNFK